MAKALRVKTGDFEAPTTTPATSLVSINPSFLLRGIEMKTILTNYLAGKYHKLQPKTKLVISNAKTSLTFRPGSNICSTSTEDESYVYKDRSAGTALVTTTNSKVYLAYKKGTLSKETHICNWCRQPFTGDPVGIPVQLKILKDGTYVFYIDDPHYKTHECALAALDHINSGASSSRDPLYLDSEQMLRLMYFKQYPNKGHLRKAPDWRLHSGNGGPLSETEFSANSSVYVRTPNLIFAPVKVEYTINPNQC